MLDEVRRLLADGHREIVLTGVHLGDYGKKKTARGGEGETGRQGDPPVFVGLPVSPSPPLPLSPLPSPRSSASITDLDGEFRIRLSSIEAAEVTPELIGLMAERRERICPHLHLPLQSGSDAVLRRMNRRGTVEEFVARCRAIRAALDRPA